MPKKSKYNQSRVNLGIVISNDIEPTNQTNKVVAKESSMLELEAPVWSAYTAKDKLCHENMQRRVTKMLHGLKGKP
ncbi:hypothetical protein BpHYR1_031334 [Brachionus plicatilis]|uniref:Uncharacterized protein n=1 Tax=Brachionus plicatilis TaxID=10195 RepID=A0A3M7QRJ1_BRAPC|nr:hypothetical protein BpHYR1_031334 [Brachionus plicatilis]